MKMKKLLTEQEQYSESGDVSAMYIHDISKPNSIVITVARYQRGSKEFAFDASYLSDVIKCLVDVQKQMK